MNKEYIIKNISKIDDEKLKNAIEELIKENKELLEQIKIDYLTGAYNRRILNDIKRYSNVAMINIDDFKIINDKYGNEFGEDVLKRCTRIFKENVRFDDIVCRYDIDEFLIIFNCCSEKIVVERMELIKKLVFNSFKFTNVNLSIGVSSYEENKSLNEAIDEANKALYKSKQNSKNKINVYKENSLSL